MMQPAQVTTEQAQHFANLAQIASDNFFTHLLGKQANHVLTSSFAQPDNDNSYQYTTFLYDENEVAGMINGWSGRIKQDNHRNNDQLVRRYAGWRYLQYLTVGIALHDLTTFIGTNLKSDDFYIQMIAIYPAYRGRGFSKILLDHVHELAQNQACNRLVLDVDERNTVAIRAYKKVGFSVIDQSRRIKEDDRSWGLLRMAKLIS